MAPPPPPPAGRDPAPRRPVLRRVLAHPLTALLVVVGILGVTWALISPPFQAPDETEHFAYSQSLAESFALPGNLARQSFSSDLLLSLKDAAAIPLAADPTRVRPPWSASAETGYLQQSASHPSRANGGGFNTASANPPLFYLYDDIPYLATSAWSGIAQLYAMRVWNVTLLLATVIAAWLLAGEVLGRRRLAQLAGAATTGLIPMQTFLITSVNPDGMLIALWTLSLWMGARVVRRRARVRDAVALCALAAAAILTKATSYALLPAVAGALALGWWRRPREERWPAAGRLGAAALVLVLPVLGWAALTRALARPTVNVIAPPPGIVARPFRVPQFLSYVWQFYLPRLPFMAKIPFNGHPDYKVWVRQAWGVFGWLMIFLPTWLYELLAAVSAVIALATLALVARLRDSLSVALTAFFGLALLGLLGLLHVADYRSWIAGDGFLLQGRYLLPLSSLLGLAVGLLIAHTPLRWRGALCGMVMAALVILQFVALGDVLRTYYT